MCSHCNWVDFLDELEEMITDDEFEIDRSFLEGVHSTVAENRHVTWKQRETVEKLKERAVQR